MPYYRGDYYRGDYYRGDGLFSTLGGLAKKALGVVARTGLGGPVIGAVNAVVNRPRGLSLREAAPGLPSMNPLAMPLAAGRQAATLFMGGENYAAQTATGQGPGTAMSPYRPGPLGAPWGRTVMGELSPAAVAIYKGTHVNRSSYYRRMPDGGVAFIEKGSVAVPNRRMNPCNGTALKRALRRAVAFKRVAMKSIRLVDAGKRPKKFAGFKTRRK
jgi:hypothetical protein